MRFILSIWISLTCLYSQAKDFSPLLSDIVFSSTDFANYGLLRPLNKGRLSTQNPALNNFDQSFIQGDYQSYILDTYIGHLAFAFPKNEYSYVFGISGLVSSEFERRAVDGELLGRYSNSSTRLYALAATDIVANVRVGLATKLSFESLDEYKTTLFTIDLSSSYDLTDRFLVHAILRDISFGRARFRSLQEEVHTQFSLGVEYTLEKAPITLGIANQNEYWLFSSRVAFSKRFEADISWHERLASDLKQGDERAIFNGVAIGFYLNADEQMYMFGYKSLGVLGNHFSFGFSQTIH
jgi:hypothetical protein